MISANFGVAILTIALRGILDRLLNTSAPKFSVIPRTSGFVFVSATIYLLYKHLKNGNGFRFNYPSFTSLTEKNLSGRIQKKKSCFNMKRRHWYNRKSRSRDTLLDLSKESLNLLNSDGCSSCSSLSGKINEPALNYTYSKPMKSTLKCVDRIGTYDIKSELGHRNFIHNSKKSKSSHGGFSGRGDWVADTKTELKSNNHRANNCMRTRSGRTYYSYI